MWVRSSNSCIILHSPDSIGTVSLLLILFWYATGVLESCHVSPIFLQVIREEAASVLCECPSHRKLHWSNKIPSSQEFLFFMCTSLRLLLCWLKDWVNKGQQTFTSRSRSSIRKGEKSTWHSRTACGQPVLHSNIMPVILSHTLIPTWECEVRTCVCASGRLRKIYILWCMEWGHIMVAQALWNTEGEGR